MLLIVLLAVAGAALGILLTTATVPRVTVAPFVSVVALTALVAATIFVSDSGDIAAAPVFVAMNSLAANGSRARPVEAGDAAGTPRPGLVLLDALRPPDLPARPLQGPASRRP